MINKGAYIRTKEIRQKNSKNRMGKCIGNANPSKRLEVRKKISDWYKNPKYKIQREKRNKKISKKLKKRISFWLFGKKNPAHKLSVKKNLILRLKGKSYEQLYGEKRAIKIKKEQSKNRMGKCIGNANPSWVGGKSFEPYSPKFNKKIKLQIKKRDEFKCQFCKNQKNLRVHHIDYNKKNNNPKNLITLCNSCNIKANFNRKKWINFFNTSFH